MRVLLVEDEDEFARGLARRFGQEGIEVDIAVDGRKGLTLARERPYDLVLLDLMLPQLDGIQVCLKIRQHSNVPIIMLTARDDDVDKVLGLEIGADDYLTKPFSFRELQARINAVMRRVRGTSDSRGRLEVGRLCLDADRRSVSVDGTSVEVTRREFDLLWLLAGHPQRVFSRQELLDRVWGYDYYGHSRAVDIQIQRLRSKIETDPANPRFLHTKWGVGYYLEETDRR